MLHQHVCTERRLAIAKATLVLLDDSEDAGRRLASRDAGRHRRAQDPAVGVVESDLLLLALTVALPDVSCGDIELAAALLKTLASRMKGAAWLIDPNNTSFVTPIRVRAHTPARDSEGTRNDGL
jgi:hypothetical protein